MVSVFDQVAEDAFETNLVDVEFAGGGRVDVDVNIRAAEASGDAVGEVDHVNCLESQISSASVKPREFEQVDDHVIETAHLADHNIESLLRPFRDVCSTSIEYLDRCGQRSDR